MTVTKPQPMASLHLTLQNAHVQSVPLYSQLASVFRDLIVQGQWQTGLALPSEADLARRFGVSVGTSRKALEMLEADGWVSRRQGRGTFVMDPSTQQSDRLNRLFMVPDGASVFTACENRILERANAPATLEEGLALGSAEIGAVVRILRVFERGGAVVMLENLVVPAGLFPGLDTRDTLPSAVFGLFLRDFGLAVQGCSETVSASAAGRHVSAALRLAEGSPVLQTRHKVEDVTGRVICLIDRWIAPLQAEYIAAQH